MRGRQYDGVSVGVFQFLAEADTEGTGYPQLTEEAVIEANPQLIVVTDQVSYTAEDVAARPGWDQVDAVRDGSLDPAELRFTTDDVLARVEEYGDLFDVAGARRAALPEV